MQVYFAPLEGVTTDSIYRRAHHAMFGGVEKYFIPFISPSESLTFSSREQRAIDPQGECRRARRSAASDARRG